MEGFKIVGGSILAAVLYGIAQDQVTARVCVEYFTIGHVNLFGTDSPTLLAFGWGIIATWWVGLLLGIPLAVCARVGSRPKLTLRQLKLPIARLLLVMGAVAAVSGVIGYLAARGGAIRLVEPYASEIEPSRHALFLADGAAHEAAYFCGFVGGVVLCVWTWRRRGFLQKAEAGYCPHG